MLVDIFHNFQQRSDGNQNESSTAWPIEFIRFVRNYYFVVRRCVSRIIFRGKGLNTGEYNLTSHLRRICVRDIEMYVLERMLLKY